MDKTYGPAELRIRWVEDDEPYDPGDLDHCEDHLYATPGCATCERYSAEIVRQVGTWGVFGCIVETRAPTCACCGRTAWEVAESLWGIVGDDAYHREIERDLMMEVAAC